MGTRYGFTEVRDRTVSDIDYGRCPTCRRQNVTS